MRKGRIKKEREGIQWSAHDLISISGGYLDLAKSDPGPFPDPNPKEKYGYG
jgi:hypothetical protein